MTAMTANRSLTSAANSLRPRYLRSSIVVSCSTAPEPSAHVAANDEAQRSSYVNGMELVVDGGTAVI